MALEPFGEGGFLARRKSGRLQMRLDPVLNPAPAVLRPWRRPRLRPPVEAYGLRRLLSAESIAPLADGGATLSVAWVFHSRRNSGAMEGRIGLSGSGGLGSWMRDS